MEFNISNIYRPMKSKLLTIRPIELEKDAEILYRISNGEAYEGFPAYNSDKIIWEYLRNKPVTPGIKGFLDYIHQMSSGEQFVFTIDSNQLNRQIGLVYIKVNFQTKEANPGGLWISPFYQDKNLGLDYFHLMIRHCFDNGAETLLVSIAAFNTRLIASVERLGLQPLRRLWIFLPNHLSYRSTLLYGLKKSQWKSEPKL